MAVLIVQTFEVIEIDFQQGERVLVAMRALHPQQDEELGPFPVHGFMGAAGGDAPWVVRP